MFPMDTEQKYRKAIRLLQVPHEHFMLLPAYVASLESCLLAPDTPDNFVLVPNEQNAQLPHIFLRTRVLDDVNEFIKVNSTHSLPDTWYSVLDEMLARVSEFEVMELDITENTLGEVAEDCLKNAVLQRY